ncbi:TPA: tetraacyldisaccharide 4'-kinase, partial [Legionella pneumophila]|nr:tetraacyldisaccharide 4'-kinase [Legionella pneumophila]
AVKCYSFSSDKLYYLPVEAKLNDSFWEAFWSHQQLQGYY